MAAITFIGSIPVVEKADFASKSHNINYVGPAPEEHEGISKFTGMVVLCALGSNTYAPAVASGPYDVSPWYFLDGTTASVTPA